MKTVTLKTDTAKPDGTVRVRFFTAATKPESPNVVVDCQRLSDDPAVLEAARLAVEQRVNGGAPDSSRMLTARQARLWLLRVGLNDEAVRAQIATIPDSTQREAAMVEWEYSVVIHLTHPLVQLIGAGLGLTQAQLRDAFITAANL